MKKRRVQVVDDSSTIRKIIPHSLHQASLPVGDILEASNGREALGMAERFTFDLILTDIDRPLMDVQSAQGTPVVVITKDASEEGVLRGMEGSLHPQALHGEGSLGRPRRMRVARWAFPGGCPGGTFLEEYH